MEMGGYWRGPRNYRIVHPVSGRHQDIVFGPNFQKWDNVEMIVRAAKKRAESELAGPKAPDTGAPRVAHLYNTAKTLHALGVYEEVLKGKIEPSPLPWVPGERRYYGDYPKHPRALPAEAG